MEIIDNGMLEFESAIKTERTKQLYQHYLNKFLTYREKALKVAQKRKYGKNRSKMYLD